MNSLYKHLQCNNCGEIYSKNELHNFCIIDTEALVADYDYENAPPRDELLANKSYNMWRYAELLPVISKENIVSLEEGFTPIIAAKKLTATYNQHKILVKDEANNPTGSFKARGISMAVSKAKELGAKEICLATAGNAGSAVSAYCARAGMKAHIFMPIKTPKVFQLDCEIMGANVTKVDGNISDAGALMSSKNNGDWFNISTLKEPFRLEGKKTMGYEIAEQLNWKLPDIIIYPTGGGTGLIGIWRAFKEMKKMGWIDKIPTRMVAVQTTGCDPIITSFKEKLTTIEKYKNPAPTIANGLRVPRPFGDKLVMNTLYESNGNAIAVSEDEIKNGLREFASNEGLFLSPEGAAVWEGYKKLKSNNWIKDEETVLLLNTGSVYKYAENLYQ